ncbi:MAG: hypothetical protein LIP16_10760 [Clostridium sp.]|nr:hypothetical protein [Clostridium sp.]
MAEKEYLNYLGIIGYEIEFLIENNDVCYYTCEINRQTDYVEIFAETADKKHTLAGDIGVLPVHKGANTFTIKLMDHDVLLKTYDISVVVRKWKRKRQKKTAEKPVKSIVQEKPETEITQEEITEGEVEETMWKESEQQPLAAPEPETTAGSGHMPPPRLLRLHVLNGSLEPDFQGDIFEYRIKRTQNKDRIVIEAEGETAEYIVSGDVGEQKLTEDEQTFSITCSLKDGSAEMAYHLHVEGVAKKTKEKRGRARKKQPKRAVKPPAKKKTKKVKERKKIENPNGVVLFSIFLCILAAAAFILFEIPMQRIHGARKQKYLELSQRREEIDGYLAEEDRLLKETEEYIQAIEDFSERYPQMQDEKELARLLDTWKAESFLDYLTVTPGRPAPMTNDDSGWENILNPSPAEMGQMEAAGGSPLLIKRTAVVEAGGTYEALLKFYELVYDFHQNILIGNIELKKTQEGAALASEETKERAASDMEAGNEAADPAEEGAGEGSETGEAQPAAVSEQSQETAQEDSWILRFDIAFYYYTW